MKKGTVTYLVHEDGTLEVKDFESRRFGCVLKKQLGRGWESDPEKLAKSLSECPDLLTVVIGLMTGWQELASEKRAKVEERIRRRTEELEAAAEPGSKVDAAADKELEALYARLAAWDDRIWEVDQVRPRCWVRKLTPRGYTAVVKAIKKFLDQRVTDAWICFSPALDTAQGRAVHDFRQLPGDFLEALQIGFLETEGVSLPLAVVTKLPAEKADEAARQIGLDARFVAVSPIVPEEEGGEPAAEEAEAPSEEEAAAVETPVPEAAEPAPAAEEPMAAPAPAKPARTRKPRKASKTGKDSSAGKAAAPSKAKKAPKAAKAAAS